MDWTEKFNSIVKETEENLAKAKDKLTGKTTTSNSSSLSSASTKPKVKKETKFFDYQSLSDLQSKHAGAADDHLAMSSSRSSDYQVLHMQDQIDSQNRQIDGLQQLVRTLNNERSFYKEQISLLKNEVEGLNDKVSSQVTIATSDRHLSGVKREVMAEVDRLRRLVHSYTEVSSRRPTQTIDSDFWTVKENLTDNLEQIRLELSLMNKRIDRMESRISRDSLGIHNREFCETPTKLPPSLRSTHTPLYSPASHSLPGFTSVDIQNMKSTISSLNCKLDSLEKSVEAPQHLHSSTPFYSNHRSSNGVYSQNKQPRSSQTSRRYSNISSNIPDDLDDDEALSDLSDLSDDISNLSDLDLENDDILNLEKDTPRSPHSRKVKSSLYKSGRKHKSKVEFDLSDLDLSDVDDVDLGDPESFDLDL